MEEIIKLISNYGIGVACVAYLIYFNSTTMKEILETLKGFEKRMLKIENHLEIDTEEEDDNV